MGSTLENRKFVGYINKSSLNGIVGAHRTGVGDIGRESVYNRLRIE